MNRYVWGWPLALGALTALGLLSALLADGGWDALSWLALGAPICACGWFGWRRVDAGDSPCTSSSQGTS